MKRLLLSGVGALALVGCGQKPERAPSGDRTALAEAAPDAMDAGRAPGISVTAAPGVAFSYEDGFRLPYDKIAGVQERHAQACEQLGLARCRITGMRYRVLGEKNIEGELSFKLAPTDARAFTKQGSAEVERAGGTLVDAEITGTDTQPITESADTQRVRAQTELKRLDAAIAATRAGTERAELQAQRQEIAQQLAQATDAGSAARASLVSTPVNFRYESGPAVRGFDTSAPFTSAINTGIASIETTLVVVLALLAIFGPPALVVALVVWVILTVRRRRRATVVPAPAD